MPGAVTIISQNEAMRSIMEHLRKVAPSDSSILLIGETGTGKEVFAEYIHRVSPRDTQPLVKIGLASVPSELLASELFGFEKGSFTQAYQTKKGLFELANHGSIFLDDIDDLPMEMQTKLLRVLESREIMRIGGDRPIPVDIRLICASKVDLRERVSHQLFREDLFYRINVVPVHIPPLRERRDDIPLLVEHFLKLYAPGKSLSFSPEALRALVQYNWPGNVRELRNIAQRVSIFAEEEIGLGMLPPEINQYSPLSSLLQSCAHCLNQGEFSLHEVVRCVEGNLIRGALEQSGGNQAEAARSLKMSLSTFRDKLHKLEDHPPGCEPA